MVDQTGAGWIKHTMYGTSKVLQHLGPAAFRSAEARSAFLEIRIFEVSHALLFTEPTFLATPPWVALTAELCAYAEDWHPKEALLDIVIQCSDLSCRCVNALSSGSIR